MACSQRSIRLHHCGTKLAKERIVHQCLRMLLRLYNLSDNLHASIFDFMWRKALLEVDTMDVAHRGSREK
jgi:hypothetical protein